MIQKEIKTRNRERTKQKIIAAVGEIIDKYGTSQVGINLVARTAGVNKVLIYRYFINMENLIEEYGHSLLLNQSPIEHDADQTPADKQMLSQLLLKLFRALRENRPMLSMLQWELKTGNSLLLDAHFQMCTALLNEFYFNKNSEDLHAFAAVMASAIGFIAILSGQCYNMMGIDLSSPGGLKRIEEVIERSIEIFFYPKTQTQVK